MALGQTRFMTSARRSDEIPCGGVS
ncbi:hypothetical protein CCACVL1_10166 [Corchorus capsularis]|uniref:Uncharacterized protein n=1 Tax=Corchorus capsularis TaxID=210143 RepID=A0A1R3ISA1_COCAP|nr:hypothetical protein CCACVL1_10166 [Corchorus capsularis]